MTRSRGEDPKARLQEAARGFVSVDEAAERAVIGALLSTPQTFLDITDVVAGEDFGSPAMAEIFHAIVACDAAGRPLDQITVADQLRRGKRLGAVGGNDALEHLVADASDVANVAAHAQIVADKALARRLVAAGRQIATVAMSGEMDAHDALVAAESAVFELGRERDRSSLVEMAQAVAETLGDLARVRTSALIGHSTGFAQLDALTGGLQGGQLIIVAGRPGTGKSAFALGVARHIAETHNLLVPFLSYEMSRSELTMRLLAGSLNFDLLKLRSGDLPSGMDLDLARAAETLAATPLLIDDRPPPTISGVRSLLRRVARRGEIGAVFVDYLQLMEGDRSRGRDDNRTAEVSEISRGLKMLANELSVPVVALSQLNRQLESRADKRPLLSDLRESGCLTAATRIARADTGGDTTLGQLFAEGARNVPVWTLDERLRIVAGTMTHVFASGHKEVFALELASGRTVEASGNHPFRTLEGWVPLEQLEVGDRIAVVDDRVGADDTVPRAIWEHVRTKALAASALDADELGAQMGIEWGELQAHAPTRARVAQIAELLGDEWLEDVAAAGVRWDEVIAVEPLGVQPVFDATVEDTHNFVANGIVAHNSLEQDASLVLMLYRDSLYSGDRGGPGGGPELAEVLIAKQRNGPSGTTVYADWHSHAAAYRDTERRPDASPVRAGRDNDFF